MLSSSISHHCWVQPLFSYWLCPQVQVGRYNQPFRVPTFGEVLNFGDPTIYKLIDSSILACDHTKTIPQILNVIIQKLYLKRCGNVFVPSMHIKRYAWMPKTWVGPNLQHFFFLSRTQVQVTMFPFQKNKMKHNKGWHNKEVCTKVTCTLTLKCSISSRRSSLRLATFLPVK